MLTEAEQGILQRLAREAIECELQGKEMPPCEEIPSTLTEPCGAFVSLHTRGRLRGCIGYIEAVKPLIETVQEVAVKAAFEDPRFPPLTADELNQVQIEISVLSPLEEVSDVSTIEVGKHGLLLELGGRRGLLLPQVALEYRWDRKTLLENTAQKAGLPPEAWQHPAVRIYKFSAEVFGEVLPPAHREKTQ